MNIQELAARQLADYDAHYPGLQFANAPIAITIEQAYELQIEVARLREKRGQSVVGYKVGCLSTHIQVQLGLDRPVFGHVHGTELHRSGAVLDPGNTTAWLLKENWRCGWRLIFQLLSGCARGDARPLQLRFP